MSEEQKKSTLESSETLPFLQKALVSSDRLKDFPEKEKEIGEDGSKDTTCGFWIFRGSFMQRFATEKMYVILYGLAGCVMTMTFAYFNATITTLEKRYKIPTKVSGIISVGNDISTMLTAALLGYYAGNGHRPRWMGIGLLTIVAFCLLTSSLHFIYGAGEDALKLTREFGQVNETLARQEKDKKLCQSSASGCIQEVGQSVPQVFLFAAQLISGVGQALFYTLGIAYMDDNATKSKTPALLSMSMFLRMLGPAIGYSLAALCLRLYIEPSLEPLIGREDPRWMGAWWLGWLVLAAMTLIAALFLFMFPKELPSSRKRRLELKHSERRQSLPIKERSFKDMMKTVRRLGKNKVYIFNTIASIFYFFGYMAYWIFTPKYIETQYRQSAAMATMATGTVALGFSAAGVLISGYVISKYKPSARAMASWNAIVDFVTVAGILCYVAIGCEGSDRLNSLTTLSAENSCSASCHCDYVHYAPVCSPDNITFISPCHAGCTERTKDELGRTIYTNCQCLGSSSLISETETQFAVDGTCPVDCFNEFLVFLAMMCFLKLVGASSKSTNLLIALRCIPEEDKTFALGLGSMAASLLGFIPSPIFFGWLIDNYCLVWGKTCTNKGNCWLYDTESLRYALNLTAASFILVGGFLNIIVWYHAKDLKIFDEEESPKGSSKNKEVELKTVDIKSQEK
ncbi:solute carrier organic anion transporter family member 74D isoform X2 [Drosophila ficusphila]|uniref:solute carrier organic anion transporter family member 74D isoform X2 n=1 Tax=Drosophila ficusphila TaxID=30025 RepID=UPI0007E84AD1|nr:solute carrier organic anion transporter family member 74D isoform X2 [Drosophila ficusphila]